MKIKTLLVVPVYNEEKILEESVKKLYCYMDKNISNNWRIVIANNGSTDNTGNIADSLVKKFPKVEAVHLKFKGRGNALKYCWQNYKADVYAYCDIDLATDISYLKELFQEIEGNNMVIGSRYLKDSKTGRRADRLIFSKVYIYLLKMLFNTKINDFQCGFKAIDNKIVKGILPLTKDREWFFDTELLLLAEAKKYKIKEIPIKWQEREDSKVVIPKTIYNYIKNSVKLRRRLKKIKEN